MIEYMNPPEPHNGQAYIEYDLRTGQKWAHCPYCGKKAIKILPETKIHNMPYKCRGSNCRKEFIVNVGE